MPAVCRDCSQHEGAAYGWVHGAFWCICSCFTHANGKVPCLANGSSDWFLRLGCYFWVSCRAEREGAGAAQINQPLGKVQPDGYGWGGAGAGHAFFYALHALQGGNKCGQHCCPACCVLKNISWVALDHCSVAGLLAGSILNGIVTEVMRSLCLGEEGVFGVDWAAHASATKKFSRLRIVERTPCWTSSGMQA